MTNQSTPQKTINTVGIVGSGTMARRIAFSCILSGKETRIYGRSPEKYQAAIDAVRGLIEERADHISAGTAGPAMNLLVGVTSLDACISGADLVIESVSENLELKREIFSIIDTFAGPETILASGTSSIPGSRMADTVTHPQNFLNFNFSGPDDLKVETFRSSGRSASVLSNSMGVLGGVVRR